MISSALVVICSLLLPLVSSHGGVILYKFDGKEYEGHNPGTASIKHRRKLMPPDGKSLIQRQWLTYDPVTNPASPLVACNDPGNAAPLTATAPAGSKVDACFNSPWAHDSGPLTVYMTECPGECSEYTDLSNAEWFPIYKEGLVSRGIWATQAYMNENSGCITHNIPSTLKPGNYLIRHESINLARVEFYANCANVKVTGSGTETPGSEFRAKMSSIYKPGDRSLQSISGEPSEYTVPGPPVWPSGGATGGQVYKATGKMNPCDGQTQDFGACRGGGSDNSHPVPP